MHIASLNFCFNLSTMTRPFPCIRKQGIDYWFLAHFFIMVFVQLIPPRAEAKHQIPRNLTTRIIGGSNAVEGRYPYSVSIQLTSTDQIVCGGSLIAPDIVMSAAHCKLPPEAVHLRINPHSLDTEPSTTETFAVKEQIMHPRYNYVDYGYDVMLILLEGSSEMQPIRLNRDPNIPVNGESLTTVGWGRSDAADEDVYSAILQEASMNYITNDRCDDEWEERITANSLCVQGRDNGFDCQGDSGGPLFRKGTDASQDLQVGITSWGPRECVNSETPSVFSRVSNVLDWIDAMVCDRSASPPVDFNCSVTFSPMPTNSPTGPTVSPAPTMTNVLVTLVLRLDKYPFETGFFIEDAHGEIVKQVWPGAYQVVDDIVREEMYLHADEIFALVIVDAASDGIRGEFGSGGWALYLGTNKNGKRLVSGDGIFERSVRHTFVTSETAGANEADQPVMPAVNGTFPVTLVINTGEVPQALSWSLSRLDVSGRPLLARFPDATYNISRTKIIETLYVEQNGVYSITLSDSSASGTDGCVSYEIYTGSTNLVEVTPLISKLNGFTTQHTISFIAQNPEATAVLGPDLERDLYLQIAFDQYAAEFGYILFAGPGDSVSASRSSGISQDVIGFGPLENYDLSFDNNVRIEKIPIPTTSNGNRQLFTLVVHDSGQDGICCSFGNGELKLFLDSPDLGMELWSTTFENKERIEYSFLIPLSPSDEVSSASRRPSLSSAVLLLLPVLAIL
jgi:secreted trypsin-like serine protease